MKIELSEKFNNYIDKIDNLKDEERQYLIDLFNDAMSDSKNIMKLDVFIDTYEKDSLYSYDLMKETLEDINGIKKYIRGLKRKGKTRKEIVEKASVKFEVPKKDIRLIYKSM